MYCLSNLLSFDDSDISVLRHSFVVVHIKYKIELNDNIYIQPKRQVALSYKHNFFWGSNPGPLGNQTKKH